MPLQIGQTIHHDRYRIDKLLGQGGMGAVYLAWDTNLEIPVAIKENLDSSPEAQKQFTREAQILARLAHPNLPRVIDNFIIPDMGQYLVMDYVEGEDLQSMLGRLGRLPEPQVLNWISQICDALAYLHNQPSPIIHRDIKPGNIKIRADGRALLVDFGIAKVYDPQMATTLGARAFTPGYSPPEQYGTGSTDRRSDIYALGATIYTLLTGRTPPDSIKRMLNRVNMSPPRQLNDEISPTVEQIILRSTDLDTDRRYQSVEELLAVLRHIEEQPDSLAKTEALPPSSAAPLKVNQPEPTPSAGKPPAPPAGLKKTSPQAAVPIAPQIIALPKRRSPTWLYILLGIVVLSIFSICGIFVASKLLAPVATSVSAPIRTTLAAMPVVSTTQVEKAEVTFTVAPASRTPVIPDATRTPINTPTLSATPFQSPPSGYLPVAQVLPLEAGQGVRGVAVYDNFLYLLTPGGILDVYDLSGLAATAELQTFQKPISSLQLQNGNGLLLFDSFLYVYGYAGLDVVDVSDPAIPGYIKSLTDQSIFNLAIFEDYLLAPGQRYLGVYSLSRPEFPRLVSQFDAGQDFALYSAIGYEKFIYTAGYSTKGSHTPRNFILDFSDPTSLRELGAYDHSRTAYHYYIFEDQLVACADSMLEIWELGAPEKPGLLYTEPA